MAQTTSSIPDQLLAPASTSPSSPPLPLPRVTIRFCTQCKWMLRAAYFAQELLSTFSTSLGEVALQPATGGTFIVEIYSADSDAQVAPTTETFLSATRRVLWDRKLDGGFPETKELKRRVRDVIEPGRNLGHVDREYPKQQQPKRDEDEREPNVSRPSQSEPQLQRAQKACEECQ
ncbi:hypothetical protein EKO27_g887 [Xylaria grammica]|uniref:Selenoprotein W-like protein n=1 Tax=Xylaria grammica TaxID=363999 RepID=A0A439DIM3_9PEZI|nr:hypothetical protein EKO27_g887 [Xylaria grammica]